MTVDHYTTTALVIGGMTILQDQDGRYRLNDLYRLSGVRASKNPGEWLKNKATQELIAELEAQKGYSPLDVVHGGDRAGTYADELLAISYAGWISPAFQLKVNQAFLDMKRGATGLLPQSPAHVALALAQAQVALEEEQKRLALVQDQQGQRQDVLETKVDAVLERKPPAGKMRPEDWLRHEAKPYLNQEMMRLFRAACARKEKPAEFRPEGMDYPLRYYTPTTIAAAYDEIMRQLILLPGGHSISHDPGIAYVAQGKRKRVRR